jgi:hypothetical protein
MAFVYIYWRSDFYKHDKFKVFLTLLSASAIIFGILAIIIQGFNYNDNLKQRDSESFTSLSKDFINDILQLFINNQDMSYYYNELLDIKKITKDTVRNLEKEHQISMLIFAKLASISYYLKTHTYGTITDGLLSRLHHILDTFFKSGIFINYWKEYKEKLAGKDIQDFVKKQYSM